MGGHFIDDGLDPLALGRGDPLEPHPLFGNPEVFEQTFQDFEVIVINDGSPDTAELEAVLQPHMARIRYIKQENRVVPVHFRFSKKRSRQPEFIERKLPEIAPRSSSATATHTEQPKSSAAVQTTLPLFDVPTDKSPDKTKEAFVWDESKGIE